MTGVHDDRAAARRAFSQGVEALMSDTRRLRGRDVKDARGGLTFPQYRMLRALVDSESGDSEIGVRVSQLASEAGLTARRWGRCWSSSSAGS